MSSPNPHLFEEPYWLIYDAIGWIRYRSKEEFGKVITIRDFRAAVLYDSPDFPGLNPAKALLHALQLGRIQGIKDGKSLPPEYWAGRKLANVHDVYLPFARVLELWPIQAAVQAPGPQADVPEIAEPAAEATPAAKIGPGRPPEKRLKIVQQMKEKYTPESLRAQKQQSLADEFGCSRPTARDARKIVLSETSLVGNSAK